MYVIQHWKEHWNVHKVGQREPKQVKITSPLDRVPNCFWSNMSTKTVHCELYESGFPGQAAAHKPAHKPKVTVHDAKHQLEWCKLHCHKDLFPQVFSRVMNHISLSGFLVWWMDLGLVDARRTLPIRNHGENSLLIQCLHLILTLTLFSVSKGNKGNLVPSPTNT